MSRINLNRNLNQNTLRLPEEVDMIFVTADKQAFPVPAWYRNYIRYPFECQCSRPQKEKKL